MVVRSSHSVYLKRVLHHPLGSVAEHTAMMALNCVWKQCGSRLCRVIFHLFPFLCALSPVDDCYKTILLWGYANHLFERHKEAREIYFT